MIIKIRKYIAIVSDFVEHEDGTITKERAEIEIEGNRISTATVWKQIPRTAHLIDHGYRTAEYEVETAELEKWLVENGKLVDKGAPADSE